MAAITIRGLDDDLKRRLRVRAALHNHSMEAEVRSILTDVLRTPIRADLTWIEHLHATAVEVGGVDLAVPLDRPSDPPAFDAATEHAVA